MNLYMLYRKYGDHDWQLVSIYQRKFAAVRRAQKMHALEKKRLPASMPRVRHIVFMASFIYHEGLPCIVALESISLADFISEPIDEAQANG